MSILEAARKYTQRGMRVVPIAHQSKSPGLKGWQRLRLEEGDLAHHFNGAPQNIGVLLGEPSGWLVDVDLDHPLAVELAPQFLPPTDLRFGRSGKPESHWIYQATGEIPSKKHSSKSAGMIVELRSTGLQTVFPPSVHVSGEQIEFIDPEAEPAKVVPDDLLEAVNRLAAEVRIRLGERAAPKDHPKNRMI